MLVGIVALIFLGPRKMPEMARKIGKIMAEFRGTANEFKETWQREVDFSEEAKSLDLKALEGEAISRMPSAPITESLEPAEAPAITEADPAKFEHLKTRDGDEAAETEAASVSDKKDWL